MTDLITLAVVQNNLISVANSMQQTAFRCSVTPTMYEIRDCACSILQGRKLSVGNMGNNQMEFTGTSPGMGGHTGTHFRLSLCRKRLIELLDKYGLETIHTCIEEMYNYNERMTRLAIQKMPDGTWVAEDFLDNNGIELDKNILMKVTVTIQGSDLTVEFMQDSGGPGKHRGGVGSEIHIKPSGPVTFFSSRLE